MQRGEDFFIGVKELCSKGVKTLPFHSSPPSGRLGGGCFSLAKELRIKTFQKVAIRNERRPCRDIIYYVRTFWKNVFINIAYLYASSRRADIINYVPTKDVFLYRTHVKLCPYKGRVLLYVTIYRLTIPYN